tara:strand:- start:16 stop:267 length:252 start_codon:yes stop_codon:yes gene_type:complete
MKDKILKVISDNSVPKHFCEYGEGIFADINAVDSMAEEIVKLFSIPVVVQQSEQLKAFLLWLDKDYEMGNSTDVIVSDYLKSL